SSGRQIAGQVRHEIIDAEIPFQRSHRDEIADASDRFCEATPNRKSRTTQAQVARYWFIDAALDTSVGDRHEDGCLAAQDRRRKRVAGCREIQRLRATVNVRIEVSVEVYIDVAERHLLRERDVPAGRNLRIIKNIGE